MADGDALPPHTPRVSQPSRPGPAGTQYLESRVAYHRAAPAGNGSRTVRLPRVADEAERHPLAEVRDELERIGIDPDQPTKGLRVRKSNNAGFVRIAGSTVPAEEMDVDADQIVKRLKEIPEGTGREEVIRRLRLPFRSPLERRASP